MLNKSFTILWGYLEYFSASLAHKVFPYHFQLLLVRRKIEEARYFMTKWACKFKVRHISCIFKKTLLVQASTARGKNEPLTGIAQFLN